MQVVEKELSGKLKAVRSFKKYKFIVIGIFKNVYTILLFVYHIELVKPIINISLVPI